MQHSNEPVSRTTWMAFLLAFGPMAWTNCSEQATRPQEIPLHEGEGIASNAQDFAEIRDTGDYPADVARAWFGLSYNLVKAERWSPPAASRFWGYAGVSLYEAVQPGMPGFESLEGKVNGLEGIPRARGRAYHWPTVANAALHAVFASFYGSASQGSRDQIDALYNQLADAYQEEVSQGMFRRSERFGIEIGQAILDWSAGDGYDLINNCPYTPPVGEGLWVPTPPAFAPPLQPCWGELRTCVVGEGSACDPGPHPPYSEEPGTPFYNEGLEVYDTVNNLTPEQRAIAVFWADSPGQTGTPPGHWIRLLGQLLGEHAFTLDVAAEAFAKVGFAEMDSFICCWFTKYELNLLRPITYIRDLFDPTWTSPIPTPPFPEYTSGHSTQSEAVAEVLTELLGEFPFTDHTHDDIGLPPRSFNSFREAAAEAAISRLYGGIHYRAAIENGLEQGRCIGSHVNALGFRSPNS